MLGVLAAVGSIVLCVPVCYLKIWRLNVHNYTIACLYVGMKLAVVTCREEQRLRVFGTGVPSTVFGSTREEVIRDWRKQQSKDLHDLYLSPNIIGLIKSRNMWRTDRGHSTENKRMLYGISVGNVKNPLQRLGTDGTILRIYIYLVEWIDLSHERGKWWPLVHIVMNVRVP